MKMISSVEEMVAAYISAWNGTRVEEFKYGFAQCWAAEATYTDPIFADVKGVDGIVDLALYYIEKSPIRTFSTVIPPEYHHRVGRYTWKADLPEATREGYDYFQFNDEYKITRLVSFFGPLNKLIQS